jgi:hypothetical protein
MPAFAPPLRDELLLPSVLEIAVELVVEVVPAGIVPEEVEVPAEDVGVVVGMKSTMVMVDCRSASGAGKSSVALKEVEHAVSGLQQAQELVVEL